MAIAGHLSTPCSLSIAPSYAQEKDAFNGVISVMLIILGIVLSNLTIVCQTCEKKRLWLRCLFDMRVFVAMFGNMKTKKVLGNIKNLVVKKYIKKTLQIPYKYIKHVLKNL